MKNSFLRYYLVKFTVELIVISLGLCFAIWFYLEVPFLAGKVIAILFIPILSFFFFGEWTLFIIFFPFHIEIDDENIEIRYALKTKSLKKKEVIEVERINKMKLCFHLNSRKYKINGLEEDILEYIMDSLKK